MKSDKANTIKVILGVIFSILVIGLIFLLAHGLLKFMSLTYNESLLMSFPAVSGVILLFRRHLSMLEIKVAVTLNNLLSEKAAKAIKTVLIIILMAPFYIDLFIRIWEYVWNTGSTE